MTITFRKCFLSFVCACSVILLSGCGGSGSGKDGFAPETLSGLTLQLIPGAPTEGVSPGMVNIYSQTASMGYVNSGTIYSAQVIYSKTGPDTATVSVSMHTPEVGTPTTVSYSLAANIVFSEDGKTGKLASWTFSRERAAETPSVIQGKGDSGSVVCLNLE